ncbi:MAG: hypothetical protein IJY23_02195 [Clostridia bacterium]|nr:hypothetical protein [Clostridia bacterium]
MKKILLLILMLALSISMLAACDNGEDDNENGNDNDGNNITTPCVEHTDDNGDHICDVCEEIIFEEDVEVTVELNIKDTDGLPLCGVKAIFTDEDGNIVISGESDADGKASATLYVGRHSVTYDYDSASLGYYLSETTSVQVAKDTTTLELYLMDNNPDGTAEKPYAISADDESITIGANTSYYYIIYRAVDVSFELSGEGVKVTYGENVYTPDGDGKIKFALLGEDTNSVASLLIENTTAAEKTYSVKVESVPGSYGNPFVIESVGATVTTATITSDDIVYYSYTASADGTFTVTLTSEKSSISMTNARNSQNANTSSEAETQTISLTVKEGDVILIDCSTTAKDGVVVTFVPEFEEATE